MPRLLPVALCVGVALACASPIAYDDGPPTLTLSATPADIMVGQSSMLAWRTDAANCSASGGWTGARATIDTETVTPKDPTTYTLTCSSIGGTTTQSVTVMVNAPPVPTLILTVLPSTITQGEASTLSWTSTNSTGCTASNGWNGWQPVSGTLLVSPSGTTTYTLSCSGPDGTITQSATVTVNAPPAPALTLTVIPTTITQGESSTLSWTSTNSTSCTASNGWSGSQLVGGTLLVSPAATTTYTLACSGAGGTITQSATVTVIAPPAPVLTLAALPTTITAGETSTLSWSSANAASCTASNGWSGSQLVSGTLLVSPTATTTYTLACSGAGGTITQSATVTVNAPPAPTLTLAILPATMTRGDTGTLSWTSTNTATCTASNGWSGSQLVSGTLLVSPTATTTYTLACSGVSGTITQSATVTVNAPPAPTLTLTALPATMTRGDTGALSWTSTNTTSCTASNGWSGSQSVSGTLLVSPTATTTYTLACSGAGGTINRSATVIVNAPPAPTLTLTALPATLTRGETSTLSWSGTNSTSCTASNGWSGSQPVSGTQLVSPATSTTYTLACSGPGGTNNRSATVIVNAPPAPTLTLTALPATITRGDTSTLSWNSTNTASCTAGNGWSGAHLVSGTQVVSPMVTTTYTLSCSGTGGTINRSVTVIVNAPPAPTLTLTALPATITRGDTSTLSWAGTHSTICTASNGWSGSQPVSGSSLVSPTTTTTYTLACSGPGGTTNQSATVTVNAPPVPTLTLTALPATITRGDTSTLSWTSTNTASCTASNGWTGAQMMSGSSLVSPATTTTYTLACSGPGGTINQSATVVVNAPPALTLTLAALPTTITAGEASTLSWGSTGATSCSASDGWSGAQPQAGTLSVSPSATTTYTLICSGAGGSISRSAIVTVNAPPPPTLTVTALPAGITTGESSVLSWASTNATSCTASNGWTGPQPLSGTLSVGPTATTIYTLDCTGDGGTISQSATVTVNLPPSPTLTLTALPSTITRGETSTLSWNSTNATSCTASGGWTGTQPTSGTVSAGPTTTTTYTLDCTGAGGTISQSATVAVNLPPSPTLTLTAQPSTITRGEPSTLSWNSTNAASCVASDGWNGAQLTSGTLIIGPTTTTTYTLVCSGPGGTISQSTTVTVNLPPSPTLTLTASPTTLTAGATTTLSWASSNATSCVATDGWTGPQALGGTLITGPVATTTYTLACSGAGGTVTQSATVTVIAPPGPTLTLTSLPTIITAGETSTLSWSSTNTASCGASNGWSGTQPISGTLPVSPTATTTYTLACSGPGGTITQSATVTVNAPPAPTLTLAILPAMMTRGDTGTLSWASTNTASCTASNGWSGSQLVSGTLLVSPTATTTYTLTCSGAGGTITQSATVTVNAPPAPTLTLTALPTTIVAGMSSTLSWSSTDAAGCMASAGWAGMQPSSGTLVASPTGTTIYTLTCSGAGGTVTQSATVTVTPLPAPTLTFTALPTALTAGEASTLTWTSTNATSCTASSGWTGARLASGTESVSPGATTIYTLTCSGVGGTVTQSATVTVTPFPAPTLTFTALPTTIIAGQSSTLTWTGTNATSCTASSGWSGTRPPSGTEAVSPAATTIYTLTCSGAGGTVTQSAAVTVTPLPVPTLSFMAMPPTILSGQSSTLTWTSTNTTGCTASNGWSGPQPVSGMALVSPIATTIYTLACSGAGGTVTQSASITVTTTPPTGGYVYPLRVGPTNRYLVDQNGRPFLMVGDAAWSLIAQLTDADADSYFATRQAQRFTLAMVNLLEHKFSAAPPNNVYGQAPFTGKAFVTPNEAYFVHVDAVLRAAASHGIVVMLDVIYLGASCSNEGWCTEVKAATTADMTTYGAYLGNRYRNFDNIIWQIGGDTDPSGVTSQLTALVNGILSADTRHPFTAHNGPTQMAVDPWGNVGWLSLNNVYTYGTTLYSNMLAAYNRTPVKPVFLIETKYENETEWNVTQQQLRSQFYWTMLSGGFGQVYGNCPVWNFDAPAHGAYCPQTGWRAQLTSPGARNMELGAALFGARHWWTLVPDASHGFLTAGFGSGETYATAAYASDGSTALAYLPTSRTVTVTGSQLVGSNMTALWYNPVTGVSTPLGSFPTAGSRSFTPPAAGDWVLVLDAQGP